MALKIEVAGKELKDVKDRGIVIAFFQDNLKLSREVEEFDRKIGNAISNSIKNKDFKAEDGELRQIYCSSPVNYVTLLGLGKEEKFKLSKFMGLLGAAAKSLRALGVENFSILLDSFDSKDFEIDNYIEKAVEALHLSLYQYNQYKTKELDKIKKVEKVTILVSKKDESRAVKVLGNATLLAEAVVRTRDLLNTPPNIAVPIYVADYAKELAKKNGLKCTIFDEKQLEKMGMECYIAVARASTNNPRMIVLEYTGNGKEKPIVLVGKGLTYDTGGINTKPANYMTTMKFDKGGACAVIHVLEACARMKLKINVVGIAAMAENSVSGNAYKPDDVLKSYSGTTVEVIHSDAEGRMVLADTLAYSLKFEPKSVIDIATLTGASIVALGYVASPVLGTDQELVDKLVKAGESSLDRLWQFPLWDDYEDIIKSDIADVRHLTLDTDAGVIIGGIFLKQFVKDTPWAHIDIGATVNVKADKGYKVKGGTGFGVLLLLDFLRKED